MEGRIMHKGVKYRLGLLTTRRAARHATARRRAVRGVCLLNFPNEIKGRVIFLKGTSGCDPASGAG